MIYLAKFDDEAYLVEGASVEDARDIVEKEISTVDPFTVEEVIFEEGIYELFLKEY